jgi:DNA-binding transcriptional LysR family regulator
MVNLEWYRSFIEVYRVGTVSGAAQVLHLTQPAVSQRIAALEAALGQSLFQRMPRRMLPTDEGKRLYTRIVEAIEKLESITPRSSRDTPQLIRLGSPQEFFGEQILNRLLQAENLLYRIQLGLAKDLIQELLAGQLDAVITTQKITRSELEYQLVYEEHFWLVAPSDTVLPISSEQLQANLTSLEQWLRSQALIAYSDDLPIVRRFWRIVFGRRLDTVPKLVLPDLRLIRQAVVAGLGFSVLPDYLCEDGVTSNNLKLILKPTNAVSNQIWLSYLKSERQSVRIKLLSNLLVSK